MAGEQDEARRLEILRRYNILDTLPDEVFDRIASVAANHFGTPIAIVSFVDEARQWFKAAYGLGVKETPRDIAFCTHTIAQEDVFEVNDATLDPLFQDNPLVCDTPHLRFYAGAPMRTRDGVALGSVAVLDREPRPPLTKTDHDFLRFLADTVVHELEIRLAATNVQAEIERRQESERRLHLALSHAPVSLGSLDADLRYTWIINPHAPMSEKDFIGKTLRDLWPGDVGEAIHALAVDVMASGRRRRVDVSVPLGGQMRDFDVTVDPLLEHGTFTGLSYAAIDVTDRHKLTADLKAARDEAEAASRAKSAFLAAASHDLRQPVQALSLFARTLESRLEHHPALDVVIRMRKSLDALQGLLASLLDISRLDAGVVEINCRNGPVVSVIGQIISDFRDRAAAKGLRFRSVGCDQWTYTDPELLARVVSNLLDNALKYTRAGGILVGCRRRGDTLLLQIIDTGHGIPPDQVEAVFQEFVQLHNPGRDRTKGLGLGLSIVRRLLALLGHPLEVRSDPGRGTCFTIALPYVSPTAAGAEAETPDTLTEPMCARRVLVIEDEEMIRIGLQMLIEDMGCTAMTASSKEEAISTVTEHGTPDLIIADYRLQAGRLGTDAVKAVQALCGTAIPAMIITGDTAPERIQEAAASGFILAHKPVTPDRLQAFIQTGN